MFKRGTKQWMPGFHKANPQNALEVKNNEFLDFMKAVR